MSKYKDKTKKKNYTSIEEKNTQNEKKNIETLMKTPELPEFDSQTGLEVFGFPKIDPRVKTSSFFNVILEEERERRYIVAQIHEKKNSTIPEVVEEGEKEQRLIDEEINQKKYSTLFEAIFREEKETEGRHIDTQTKNSDNFDIITDKETKKSIEKKNIETLMETPELPEFDIYTGLQVFPFPEVIASEEKHIDTQTKNSDNFGVITDKETKKSIEKKNIETLMETPELPEFDIYTGLQVFPFPEVIASEGRHIDTQTKNSDNFDVITDKETKKSIEKKNIETLMETPELPEFDIYTGLQVFPFPEVIASEEKHIDTQTKNSDNFDVITDKERKEAEMFKFFRTIAASPLNSRANSFFSEQFSDTLKDRLGLANEFKLLTKTKKEEKWKEIEKLLLIEHNWKVLVSKSKYESNYITSLFPKEVKQFQKNFPSVFFPSGENLNHPQVLSKFASTKCSVFYTEFYSYLINKPVPFLLEVPLVSLNVSRFLEEIHSEVFFVNIVKICMKKVFDQNINIENKYAGNCFSKILSNPFLCVTRNSILSLIQQSLVMYLSNQLIEVLYDSICANTKKQNLIPRETLLEYIYTLIEDNRMDLLSKPWYLGTFDVANNLIDIFCYTDVVLSVENFTKKSEGVETHKTLWLSHKISETIPFSHHLPRIIPPKKINLDENINSLVSNVTADTSSISMSLEALKALNIAQSKSFVINDTYTEIIDKLHNNPNWHKKFEKKPLPSKLDLEQTVTELENWGNSDSVNVLQRHEVNHVEQDINYKIYSLTRTVDARIGKRRLFQTTLEIVKIFKGFSLYYGTKLDYRTQIYPREYLISRITGELKQILFDEQGEKLTLDGLLSLMSAYYRYSLDHTVLFKQYCEQLSIDKIRIRQQLKKFFQTYNLTESILKTTTNEQVAYFMMLHKTLEQEYLHPGRKVHINLEIDQTASGFAILALVFGIRDLAEQTNLLKGVPVCIYTYVMSKVPDYFMQAKFKKNTDGIKTEHPFDQNRSLLFLSSQKKAQKGALIRWGYSQGWSNILNQWLDEFSDHYGSPCSEDEYLTLRAFSQQYDVFLETLFPKMQMQKDFFVQVMRIRAKATEASCISALSIKTLDGCCLLCDYDSVHLSNKTYFNPSINSSVSYKMLTGSNNSNALKSRMEKHEKGIFPNIIHSIDAAIMRSIILHMYNEKKYTVNYLDDCVLLHPNYVTHLYKIISDIYTGPMLLNIADNVFFDPMKESLALDVSDKISTIQKKFRENQDTIDVLKKDFIPENMYVMEGCVSNLDVYTALSLRNTPNHDTILNFKGKNISLDSILNSEKQK